MEEALKKPPLMASNGEDAVLDDTDSNYSPILASAADSKPPSARERAVQKRKSKMAAKKQGSTKQLKSEAIYVSEAFPVEDFISTLKSRLLCARWQARHGACMGLKAVVSSNARFGQDLQAALVEVLLRERFADYVGDNAVSPVRETAAQLYSLISQDAEPAVWMAQNKDRWEIRHAGLLAIKYLVACRATSVNLHISLQALRDSDDDVRLQALEILKYSRECHSSEVVESITDLLEDSLDEVTPSCAAALDLLSTLNLTNAERLIKTLLPMIRHSSTRIRKSSLQCLSGLCCTPVANFTKNILQTLFQVALLEDNTSILQILHSVETKNFAPAIAMQLFDTRWRPALCTPLLSPFDPKLFYYPLTVEAGSLSFKAVPAHELGFKVIDMMSIGEGRALESRLSACRFVRSILTMQADALASMNEGMSATERIVFSHLVSDCKAHATDAQEWSECYPARQLLNLQIEKYKALSPTSYDAAPANDNPEQLSAWGALLDARKHHNELSTTWTRRVRAAYGRIDAATWEHDLVDTIIDAQEYMCLRQDAAHSLASFYRGATGAVREGFSKVRDCTIFLQELQDICTDLLLENEALKDSWNLAELAGLDLCRVVAAVACLRKPFASIDTTKQLLDRLYGLLRHEDTSLRSEAAHAIAVVLKCASDELFLSFIEGPLAELDRNVDARLRHGVVQTCSYLLNEQCSQMVRFVGAMLAPTLARTSDHDSLTRSLASENLAIIIRLIALGDGVVVNPKLRQVTDDATLFLKQLGDPSLIPSYSVEGLNAELRHYQQAGLNWLAFLNRSGLHGALCDDMGLGKTLQALAILSGDHRDRKASGKQPLRSLVICPSSLTGHWQHEVAQYTSLTCFPYIGNPQQRRQRKFDGVDLFITSYDIARADADMLCSLHWNYVILDEGHIIRNASTKAAQAIKQLCAEHRLVLSGTPIQNNVLELWSLFDFLMPGFLGDEKAFTEQYAKPILAAQLDPSILFTGVLTHTPGSAGSSAKLDSAEARLNALHKQVLPFILRRMKEDVLKELPPKIIQDYTCEMTPLQRTLYSAADSKPGDALKKLAYLRKLCTHPQLVLPSDLSEFPEIQKEVATCADELSMSPKLSLLRELLVECGVGQKADREHRVLIFAQQRSTLNLVDSLVLRSIPDSSFLRLDGTVPAAERFGIVRQFNSDSSIDCLLLTTHVGGLGLNLTSADTVIFVEPDWNPMADLQAMDRAHRLGQKRTVTVYRLVMAGTVEERVMGMQRWKTKVAGTVVTQQNATMQTLGADAMLDLFAARLDSGAAEKKDAARVDSGVMQGDVSDNNVDPEGDYLEQFDMLAFLRGTSADSIAGSL